AGGLRRLPPAAASCGACVIHVAAALLARFVVAILISAFVGHCLSPRVFAPRPRIQLLGMQCVPDETHVLHVPAAVRLRGRLATGSAMPAARLARLPSPAIAGVWRG